MISKKTEPWMIRVENLGKSYEIDRPTQQHLTLQEQVINGVKNRFSQPKNKNKQTVWALRNLSFTVSQGEIVGIIGHNGAGKSTLLKILAGITIPSEGDAFIRGRIASLLEVGTGFHPELTGRENVFLNGAIMGMTRKEITSKFDQIVNFADCKSFLDTPIKRYSSGMALRLAFAVAAHLEPEILLIDEVLAVGDAAFQKKCLHKIDKVAEMGRTILFVSHDLNAIQSLCSRTIYIDQGGVVADGDSTTVISTYLKSQLM